MGVVRRAIGDGAMLKKDRRRLWLMAVDGPTQRRISGCQIVRISGIALQNLLKLVVHPIGCCGADVGYCPGIQKDFGEIFVIQFKAIVQRHSAVSVADIEVRTAFNEESQHVDFAFGNCQVDQSRGERVPWASSGSSVIHRVEHALIEVGRRIHKFRMAIENSLNRFQVSRRVQR